MERYIGGKKQWERKILVPRASILLTSPMDWELLLQAQDNGWASTVCTFTNLWGSAENQKYCDLRLPAMVPPRALIHGIGQKDENKKKSRKNWCESGRKKLLIFAKIWGIQYTQNVNHNPLHHIHRNKHIVKKIASHWNWEIIMCRTTVVQSEYR